MSDDMNEFLGVFLEEAGEQLELLERSILRLENGADDALIQEIFRAAHTLKGSSRAMGFLAMGDLTHAMEDVFDRLRRHDLQVDRGLVDALFQGLDLLKTMRDEAAEGGGIATDPSDLTARLRAAIGQGGGETAAESPSPEPPTRRSSRPRAFRKSSCAYGRPICCAGASTRSAFWMP